MRDEEYRGVDERLLDDFQRELDAEKKKSRARMVKVAVGLVLGLAVAGGFAYYSGMGGSVAAPAPVAEGAGAPPMVDDLVTPRTVNDDDELSRLAGENQIEQDVAPPGSLMTVAPDAVGVEPPPAEEPPAPTPEPEAALTPPSPAGVFFSLQMRAFDDPEEAERERDRLRAQGIDAWIGVGKGERRLHAVDVGSFRSAQEARRQSTPLKYHGYPNQVTLLADGRMFTLRVGNYATRGVAVSTAARVSGSGFPATVHETGEPITLHLVRVGRHVRRADVEKEAARLRSLGYPSLGVVEAP